MTATHAMAVQRVYYNFLSIFTPNAKLEFHYGRVLCGRWKAWHSFKTTLPAMNRGKLIE